MRAFFRALANALTAPWVLALALTLFFVLLAWFLLFPPQEKGTR